MSSFVRGQLSIEIDVSTEDAISSLLPDGIRTFDFQPIPTSKLRNYRSSLSLELKLSERTFQFELEEKAVLAPAFELREKSNQSEVVVNYQIPIFYGIEDKEQNISISISLKEERISGIIQIADQIYNLGYENKIKKHVFVDHSLVCDIDYFQCEQIGTTDPLELVETKYQKSSSTCNNDIEIYLEADYDMFVSFNNNSTLVSDYITSVFNEVNQIYSAENIPILISQIVVWVSDDPYQDNSSGIYDFATEKIATGFVGDVAQLITNDSGQNGGIAYVDQLCNALPFSYCDIVNSYEIYPTYSWDVQVIAHELGHTFGSQHTHDCVWGPNGDEQIDDCGNVSNGGGDACYDPSNPIIPPNGGTIMSYCHTDPVGIDFLNGFGMEPGDLIRQKHLDCFCDNATCNSAIELIVSGTYYAEPEDGNGASTSNATHADWFIFTPQSDATMTIASCDEGVDTRVWVWEGQCGNLIYYSLSDDDCHSSGGANYASEIIDLPLIANVTYYIEWDNRWSINSFDWTLDISYIDPTCDGEYLMASNIVSDTTLHAKINLSSDAQIGNNHNITFKTESTLDLLPGFELGLGSKLEITVQDCENP
ncbi:MAG: hypothetical protein HKO66_11215 [Saprospiraceae bacterium]|nr:zinc-dependent metalloprotease [Bacteroidia bacterium]NNE14242.1 hypothetical protein [Saprospiraceae bacterium]NNL92795.1 hypothetical protein [Saprospiraceae bacterium]